MLHLSHQHLLPKHSDHPDGSWVLHFHYDNHSIKLWVPNDVLPEDWRHDTPKKVKRYVSCRRTTALLVYLLPKDSDEESRRVLEIAGEAHCSPTDNFCYEAGRLAALLSIREQLLGDEFAEEAADSLNPLMHAMSAESIRRHLFTQAMQAYQNRRKQSGG